MRVLARRSGRQAGIPLLIATAALALAAPPLTQATTPTGKTRQIAFQREGDVWITDPIPGGEGIDLTSDPSSYESLPAFTPNGRRLLFFRNDFMGSEDLWTMGPNGSGQDNLTETADETEFSGVYFPDGRRIAFSLHVTGSQNVWVMKSDGSDRRELTTDEDLDDYVNDVSPDGRRILFSVNPEGASLSDFDLWVMNANGSNPHPLTATPSPVYEQYSAFSPNGKRIVFDRCDNFDCDIWIMNANGTGAAPVVDDPVSSDHQPIFSPNGKRIIYTMCFSDCDIARVKLDGSGRVGLTDTDAPNETVPDAESIQLCGGRRATIGGDDGPDKIRGTRRRDVIDANGGRDVVRGRGGNDVICGGKGPDKLLGGKGRDRLFGGKGSDTLRGGPGRDRLRGGPGRNLLVQ